MSDIPAFTIIRSHRQSIVLHITPRGELEVKAPYLMPGFLIKQFVKSKIDWIEKRLEYIKTAPKPRKYVDGDEFLYLGKSYTLHIGNYKEISLTTTLQLPIGLAFRAEKELTNWYIKQAKEYITQRVIYRALQMEVSYKSIFFSDTRSKWGTCGPDNSLQFNWRLIMAPLPVLDSVVIHELAHTKEKNHSEKFWNIVHRYTPAYRQHRKWLNSNAGQLVV